MASDDTLYSLSPNYFLHNKKHRQNINHNPQQLNSKKQ
ncbi:hypothetical protein PLUTE_a2273 [Pseudoalteromonas luteoviolacea DSM 6061]|nr:hypothetical protein [Pseudoalteromonas luteoviolacea DSM 6061]